VLAALALVMLPGCISTSTDASPPDFATLLTLRHGLGKAVATGNFGLASPSVGAAINIRGSTMHPPKGQSFADVLEQAIAAQLRAAGRFDATAPIRITGLLTGSRAGEDLAHGHATLVADIVVMRGGTRLFARRYDVVTSWDSSFLGAIAIPEAFRQYNALYDQLSRKILSDPDLIAAVNAG
jgi:hypothetical protein